MISLVIFVGTLFVLYCYGSGLAINAAQKEFVKTLKSNSILDAKITLANHHLWLNQEQKRLLEEIIYNGIEQ